jgi:DNA polymerase-3 subunit epsilon
MLRSFDDLGTPLHEVTFCVVDLETTGGSARACAITEVGAARFQGGECLGTFQTLVNPGEPIAPTVSRLTGITDEMVRPAPPVSAVLPTLAEFVGGSVLVGHNLRFDVSFLDAALSAGDRSPVGLRTVDTVALARRLLRDEVPDCRLGTLAQVLDLDHRPTHRALDDVLATADLLHLLLERAAGFGVTLLDDLLQLPRLAAHPRAAKLPLTNRLPRSPGVYVLRDAQGRAVHVGRADVDLRRQVRSLFAGDDQRTVGPLLREVHSIDHVAHPAPLAAAVAEIRLAQALGPRRAPRFGAWSSYRYVKLGGGRAPRLTVSRTAGPAGGRGRVLGPLPSAAAARAVVEAVGSVVAEQGPELADGATPGRIPAAALFDEPALVLSPLHRRMAAAHDAGHYAHAVIIRQMIEAVTDAVERQRGFDRLRGAGRVVLELSEGGGVVVDRGRLVRAWAHGAATPADHLGEHGHPGESAVGGDGELPPPVEVPDDDGPLPLAMADELACVGEWLDRHAHRLRPVHVEGTLASPLPRVPRVEAADATAPAGLRCAAC